MREELRRSVERGERISGRARPHPRGGVEERDDAVGQNAAPRTTAQVCVAVGEVWRQRSERNLSHRIEETPKLSAVAAAARMGLTRDTLLRDGDDLTGVCGRGDGSRQREGQRGQKIDEPLSPDSLGGCGRRAGYADSDPTREDHEVRGPVLDPSPTRRVIALTGRAQNVRDQACDDLIGRGDEVLLHTTTLRGRHTAATSA